MVEMMKTLVQSRQHAFLEKLFRLTERKTTVRQEMIAGMTSFATVAYAILLVPTILSSTGMDFGAAMTATLIASFLGTLFMGVAANYPFVLAPGVALSAFFAYSVVLAQQMSWQQGIAAVFVSSSAILFLTVTKIRHAILKGIPYQIRLGVTGGLGFFLAFIGLKNAGVIVADPTTFVTFGTPSLNMGLTFGVLLLMGLLMAYRISAAFIFGILAAWLVGIACGEVTFNGLISWPSSLSPSFLQWEFPPFSASFVNIILSFLFVTFFDASGTILGLAEEGGFVSNSDQKNSLGFPRATQTLLADPLASLTGSCMGLSPVTVFLESAAGIGAGGRTGLTAVVAALLFLCSLFFAPFAASIPIFAVAPILVLIGGLMMRQIGRFDYSDATEWIPGFLTFILIPLSFSVATELESA